MRQTNKQIGKGSAKPVKRAEEALRQALEESKQRQAEISALLEGSRAILKHREFKEAARSIFDSCKNLVGATAGYIALLSEDGTENEVLFLDSGGLPCRVDPSLTMPIRGLRAEAYRTGQAIYHNDFPNSEWVQFMPHGHVRLENALFAPLMIEGKTVGLLGIANKPGGFTENDAHIASAFGELAAIALLNSRILEALEHSEERFRSVAQSAGDAIICDDPRGNIVVWNRAAEAMFGYTADEVMGKPVICIMPERLREAHQKGMQRVALTGESSIIGKTVESVGLRKDGTEFPIELSLAKWQTGEGTFFTAILRDITERKRAGEEYRTIISTAMDGFWITDMQGRFWDVNDAYCHLIGYSREELLKMRIQDVEAAEKPEETAQHIQKLIETGHDRFKTQHRCKDGRIVDIEVSVNFIPSHGGRFYVFLRDITERKQAEEALQKAHDELERRVQERTAELAKANEVLKIEITERKQMEEALRTERGLFIGGPTVVFKWKAQEGWPVEYVSPNVTSQFGYNPDDLTSDKIRYAAMIHPDDLARVGEEVTAYSQAGVAYFEQEYRIAREDGQYRWIYDFTVVIRDSRGAITHYHGYVADITDRKMAEEEIQRENDTRTVLNTLLRLSLEDVSLDELLTQALDLILSIPWLAFESRGAIFLAEDDQVLVLKGQRGLAEPIQRACARVPFGRCLCGRAAAEQKTRFADRLDVHHEITYEGIGPHGHYCVPILSAGKTLGVINVYLSEGHRRDIQEEKFLLAVADTLAGSIERKGGEEILKKLSSVVEQATDLVFITDYDGVIEYVNPAFELLTGYAKDEAIGQTPRILKSGKHTPDEYKHLWETIRAGKVLQGTVVNRKKNGELYYEEKIITPLQDEQGNITHFVSTGRDITERKRAEEQIERQIKNLNALHTIDTAIAGSLDLRLTLDIALEQVITQLGMDAADVLLLNPHTQTLEYASGRGFRSKAIERSRCRMGEGHAGRAALERRTVHISDLSAAIEEFVRAELLSGEDFVTYTGVPLIAKGEVKGMLEVYRRTPFDPSTGSLQVSEPEWLSFLEILAGQVAVAVDSAQLFTGLQRSNIELSIAYDTTIEGWSRALDLRDEETEGHTQRVTELTLQLARGMGLSEAELVHIRRGCLLHDIGKMGIPDNILRKPGSLTDEEWVIMRKHPQYAFEMLSPIAYLRPALDIPGCHHEKWDGTGYPRGLKGEQIPLAARIFAVIDVYDALTSDRPYRKAWTKEKTLEHIKSGVGSHFDPQVAEAFLKLFAE